MYQNTEALKQAALSGDVKAQYDYGVALSVDSAASANGDFVLLNTWREGTKWLRSAGNGGDINALICLARIYEKTGDSGKMFMTYTELADKYNNPYGNLMLAKIYEARDNMPRAYYYYDRAAKLGNEEARFVMQYRNPKTEPIDTHPQKSYVIYGLLGLFFGAVGLHNFYAGQTKKGIIKIVLCLTLVGSVVTSVWGVYEGLIALIYKNIKD